MNRHEVLERIADRLAARGRRDVRLGHSAGKQDETDAEDLRMVVAEELWKPIGTAPKDGTRFLGGFVHKTYGWQWDGCRFYEDKYHPEGYFVLEGGGKPTHWLPLPKRAT